VYSQPDILLIDDAFSALDKEVSIWVWSKIIAKPLKSSNRLPTRIVVTHDFDLADKADEVLVMEKGKVGARGLWKDLLVRADGSNDNPDDPVGKCVKQYLQTLDQENQMLLDELNLIKADSENFYETKKPSSLQAKTEFQLVVPVPGPELSKDDMPEDVDDTQKFDIKISKMQELVIGTQNK